MRTIKKIFCLILTVVLVSGTVVVMPALAAEPVEHLIINQFYGDGGKKDGEFTHCFIELYNPTKSKVSLDGYTLHYSSNRSGIVNDQNIALSGKIPSQTSFLVRGAAVKLKEEGVKQYSLSVYDIEDDTLTIDNKDTVVIRLLHGEEQIDAVSTREGTVVEGGLVKNSGSVNKHSSIRRIAFADTDDNATDFEVLDWEAFDETFAEKYKPRSLKDGSWTQEAGNGDEENGRNTASANGKMVYLGGYETGVAPNADGGIAEIVKYNSKNKKMYLVNGSVQSVDIVSLEKVTANGQTNLELETRLDMGRLSQENGFSCTDITSVDISPKGDLVALAVQSGDSTNGFVVLLDADGNYLVHVQAGVQPDMITFTPNGKYILTADEGEPRGGYQDGAEDPAGSVTIVDVSKGWQSASAQTIGFEDFDSEEQRKQMLEDGVLLKPGTNPSKDLEPEYIAVSSNSRYAYVSLQEANAIATLDLSTKRFISVKGLGFKDFSLQENAVDLLKNDDKSQRGVFLDVYEDTYGVYMPDGIATASIKGKNYIFSANEGDAREWAEYEDTDSWEIRADCKKVDVIKNSERDGLDDTSHYLYGARSFSIWDASTMKQVYDSGSDFERITAELLPDYFNCSNDDVDLDSRSSKKGPEPEGVTVLTAKNKLYAFVGLERIGGIMMYDVSTPEKAQYCDYINLRDFSQDIAGSVAPEGLCAIPAKNSPTGYPMLLVANEVSGNVDVLRLKEGYESPNKESGKGGSSSANSSAINTVPVSPSTGAPAAGIPWDGSTTGPTGGALYLDTASYAMAPGVMYDIGIVLKGCGRESLRVYSSRSGIARVEALPNGNYRVAGLSEGTTYIVFQVLDANSKVINHASVKVEIKAGAQQSGVKNYWASLF